MALAREKHFSRAAERCHVIQSTLSSGLKALERELDMRLVIRGPRFLGLPPEGERVDVRSLSSIEIQNGLDKFEIDAGLTYLENEPLTNVRKKALYRERYLFVTHADSHLAQTDAITWRDATAENLCPLHESMKNRRVLNNLVASLGLKLAPTVTTDSFLAVCSHVCSGEWSSIVPHTFSFIFRGCKELGLVDLIDPVHSQAIGLVASARDPLSPLAHALMHCATRLDVDQFAIETADKV